MEIGGNHPIWDKEYYPHQNKDVKRENCILHFLRKSNCVVMNDGSVTRISPIFGERNSALDLTIINKNLIQIFRWFVSDQSFSTAAAMKIVVSHGI